MIFSAHRLTGFWFESDWDAVHDKHNENASAFLASSLEALREFDRGEGEGQSSGAINTGYDPVHLNLSPRLPGFRWLNDRLRWMKLTFQDFDDKPENPKDPEERLEGRNPFPAFHWTIRYSVDGRRLPLDGVQVLIGHDVAVVHEFSIALHALDDIDLSYVKVSNKRFAVPPEPSARLFTASFSQLSGLAANRSEEDLIDDLVSPSGIFNHKIVSVAFHRDSTNPVGDWSEGEFGIGRCSGVKASLRCAVRADNQSYQGCVFAQAEKRTEAGDLNRDFYSQVREHIDASAYLTFFCILLVNDSKVAYEVAVADRVLRSLRHNLEARFNDARALVQTIHDPARLSFPGNSVSDLIKAHSTDGKLLDHFDHLVETCQLNADQFEQGLSRLLESDNRWTADVRRRLGMDCADLREAQRSLRYRYKTTEAKIDTLPQKESDPRTSRPAVRDRIFVSYSHKDGRKALQDLTKHLPPALSNLGPFGSDLSDMIWDDTKIKPGAQWLDEIKTALSRAKAAILLVTPEFLVSNFIQLQELPELLRAAKKEDLLVLWIHVTASTYEYTDIAGYQPLHNADEPLDDLKLSKRNREWVKICKKIRKALDPTVD